MPWIGKIYYNLKIEKQRKAYVKKQTEIWRKNNPGARKKHDDKYSVTHVEEKKIGDAIYYEKNIKKFSVWAAKYYQDHKDEILKRIKENYWADPETMRKRNHDNYYRDIELTHNRNISFSLKYRHKIKTTVFSHYSKNKIKCACCKTTGIPFLTMDHIIPRNDMTKVKKLEKIGYSPKFRGITLYIWLKNNHYPEPFQVLCWNCNFAKYVLGACPHHRQKNR